MPGQLAGHHENVMPLLFELLTPSSLCFAIRGFFFLYIQTSQHVSACEGGKHGSD